VVNGSTVMVPLSAHNMSFYYAVQLLVPFKGNENALGHTINSPSRLKIFEVLL
jgi:hypothetical protein